MTTPTLKGLQGLEKVLRNLNKQTNKIEGRTLKGLIRGAIIIRRDMDHTSPKIPVDLGNLRAGFFIVTSKGTAPTPGGKGFTGEGAGKLAAGHQQVLAEVTAIAVGMDRPAVVLGFSADYAVWVHEMINADFTGKNARRPKGMKKDAKLRREGAGAKFLEASVKRNTQNVLAVIAEEAKIR